MAKVKLGAIVVDMRGKLGGHVFAQNKGGNYVRTKTTPSNPQTVAQSSVRNMFANISQGWSQLTQAGRDSFDNQIANYAKTNVFGDLKNPTGKALYQRLNQNLALTEQLPITACVPPTVLEANLMTAANGTVAAQIIELILQKDGTGNKIMISATPPLSAGTKFVKNKLRTIAVGDGIDNNFFTLDHEEYTNKFGPFVLGSTIFIGLKSINANGQASPLQIMKLHIEV